MEKNKIYLLISLMSIIISIVFCLLGTDFWISSLVVFIYFILKYINYE